MKVLLLTLGTRGDVQPFVALANALNAAGHEAILGAPAGSAFLAESYGVHFIPLYDTMSKLTEEPSIRAALAINYRGLRGKKLAIQTMRKFRLMMSHVLDDMAAIPDQGADLVICHPSGFAHEVAERLGVPAVLACVEPLWVPTKSFTNPIVQFRVPRALNPLSYLTTRLWIRGFVGSTSKWRTKTLGLPRRRGHRNPLLRPDGTPATVLHAFSRHVLPTPTDYPDWVHTTGFWFLPAAPDWTPPRRLTNFLSAGDPPVYIGFGSIVGIEPSRIGNLVVESVRLAGVRAVVVPGRDAIHIDESVENIFSVAQAPFDWLFPRMAAIVHHGGIGTTGAALASGRPQAVCPAEATQRFTARRMYATGVAAAPLPQPELTPERLAEAIRRAVTDRTMATRAERVGHQIRAEKGVTAAVKVLESLT